MALLMGVVGYALWVYILLILARIVLEWTRQFARKWRPAGAAAVGMEIVYTATDPPIRLLRRLVPPLQLGTVRLDLSVIILLIVLIALRVVALTFV
ncbi:MAG: YggT family protein [Jatrophihabitans sp.]|jgi:YggT family protein|nr:YggT family protein [Jatrophihabitans sp.]MCW2656508.1 YggT family protein [Jatrophihabitans sp.]MDT4900618.1 YggT family protein [Pseudonocardiales bacterium]MDT4903851.1 YggT family protein [Pseudonocardiales bacterium]MDT4931961.1 YggT family protein [Pseudonocardiales bacterium]